MKRSTRTILGPARIPVPVDYFTPGADDEEDESEGCDMEPWDTYESHADFDGPEDYEGTTRYRY